MSTSRCYLLPLLLLAPLNILCAKLLLTPQTKDILDNLELTDRGWPWPFYESAQAPQFPASQFSLFRWHILAADLAILGGFIALCAALIVWHMRRHHGKFQISLRAMLFFIALAAAGLGWWFNECNYSKREARFFANSGNIFQADGHSPGPAWLKRLTGNYELFDHTNAVRFVGDRRTMEKTNLLLPRLAELTAIRRVSISNFDSAWGHLGVAAPFEGLELPALRFYGDTIGELRTLKRLQSVVLHDCPDLTDEQLRQFATLPNLQHLTVPRETPPETVAWLKERIPAVDVPSSLEPSPTLESYLPKAMSQAMANALLQEFKRRSEEYERQMAKEPSGAAALP